MPKNKTFRFTPANLIANLDKLGAWSSYGLAETALKHYFPYEYDEDGYAPIETELRLMKELNCDNWQDAIIKYHNEVGYKGRFNPKGVNQY